MRPLGAPLGLALLLLVTGTARAQQEPRLLVEREDGSITEIGLTTIRGFAAVELRTFEALGWSAVRVGADVALTGPDGIGLTLRLGSPFFRWDGEALQLTDAPYAEGVATYLPVQLLTDFLPRRVPELYAFDGPTQTLRAGSLGGDEPPPSETRARPPTAATAGSEPAAARAEPVVARAEPVVARAEPVVAREPAPPVVLEPEAPTPTRRAPAQAETYDDGIRTVVIDPGHGGHDPGSLGPAGIREKAVALGIGLALADILGDDPRYRVHMIREDDSFVPLWNRGQIATDLKAERHGIFLSIHANSFPSRRAARGFETYFLSEARTEHERRVAAIENAPLSVSGEDVDLEGDPDLQFILRELRNLDHQHWSALLAEMVQDEMATFHPGPNRGVKQGLLAVLTNALMPSVLIEVGYLSNADEGRLLGTSDFQNDAARAIARAVVRFFERYPPGAGGDGTRPGEQR